MRILHISDIHMPRESDMEFKNFVMNPLLTDLKEYQANIAFDMVCLTGDLVHKGATEFSERDRWAQSFTSQVIDPLLKDLNLPRERLFMAPGNHDMWRDRDSKVVELGMMQMLKSLEAVNRHFDDDSGEGIARTFPYSSFRNTFYEGVDNARLLKHHALFKTTIGDAEIGIACLSTSWRSYSDETDRQGLIMGERQILDAREFLENCGVKIALMHHPLDWLSDFDRRCVQPMLENSFQLIFCGHQHSATAWVKTDIYDGVFVSVAPSNWIYGFKNSALGYANGYSIIDFDASTNEAVVTNRRYSFNKDKYVANNDLGDEIGVARYRLPSSKEMLKWQYEIELSTAIKNSHFDEMNEHLLTFNTETTAPQDIQSLFVFPRIVEKIELKGEKKSGERETPLEIDVICTSSENLLIFGVKESGKTLLLDDILIHLTNNVKKYRRVPVLLDFKRISRGRIETLIARYLGISITCIEELLTAHDVIILLDNISFSEYEAKNNLNLEMFHERYPRCKFIGCAHQATEGAISVDVYEHAFCASWKKMHIKAFGATETRKLIRKWFSTHPQPDTDAKVEKLLDALTQLNLPRTPLAISMFLWILEKQENYEPVNNATMIENFVEKLFQKHARREIYADRFDFKNKLRLLAEIAHQMLIVDDTDYRMSSRALIDFIDDHLKLNKFDVVQARTVLEHFIVHGLLVEDQDGESVYVRFRFACFLHYFLMKKMEFDPTFKTKVLRSDNMLMFPDEIELYTGTKRDAVDVLEIVVKRMEAAYADILSQISQLPETFDQIFDSDISITASLDDSFMSKLTTSKKPTQAELDAMHDDALESIQFEKGIRRKAAPTSKKKEMELLWTLSAQVLRNTEETKIANLKYRTYVSVLKCSMAHAFLWKVFLDKFIADNEGKPDFILDEEVKIQRDALPLIHELWLRMLLGTLKLSVVMHEKIESDKTADKISDYERFISVFLYADIRGRAAFKILREFVRTVKKPKLVDMSLFKLLGYYFLRSKNKEQDGAYENLIGDLLIKARGLRKRKKGEVIQHFREKRAIEARVTPPENGSTNSD